MYSVGLKLLPAIFKDYSVGNNERMDSSNETISRLKFIGHIQEGEKINVKYMYVQPDGILTRIARTIFAQDNRTNAYTFIENTINRSFDIITLSKYSSKSTERAMAMNIIKDLDASLIGVNNLKKTYIADVMFCCKLDTLIEGTRARIIELKDSFDMVDEDDGID